MRHVGVGGVEGNKNEGRLFDLSVVILNVVYIRPFSLLLLVRRWEKNISQVLVGACNQYVQQRLQYTLTYNNKCHRNGLQGRRTEKGRTCVCGW